MVLNRAISPSGPSWQVGGSRLSVPSRRTPARQTRRYADIFDESTRGLALEYETF